MRLLAKIFQIIGIVFTVIFALSIIVILPIINRLLKGLNRSFSERKFTITQEVAKSEVGVDTAKEQVEAIKAATDVFRRNLEKTISLADSAVAFLDSNAFQFGLPVLLWILFFMISLPRGLRKSKRKKKRKRFEAIPPPSWENKTG